MTPCFCLILAGGFLMAAENEDAVRKEQACFEGVWRFALVEVDGKKQPEAPFETNKVIISKDGRFVVVQGTRITRGIMKLDPSHKPKHFDVTVTHGPAKGRTTRAIYELVGDTYKVCGSYRSNDRPTSFDSKPGRGLIVQVLKREKQDLREALLGVGRQELAGTWQAVSYARDGNEASYEDLKSVQLVMDPRGQATVLREGKVLLAGSTKLDPTADPMTLDLTFTEGDSKGQTALGIYRIEGDLLTICRAASDRARPTAFTSRPGSGQALMTYRRQKAATNRP
jgi:uncharacterized protein (TIGR03067 family)